MTTSDALLMGLLLDTPPINPSGGGGGGSRYTVESLTFSGGLITDAVREAGVEGDGLTPPAGVGIWPAATNKAIRSTPGSTAAQNLTISDPGGDLVVSKVVDADAPFSNASGEVWELDNSLGSQSANVEWDGSVGSSPAAHSASIFAKKISGGAVNLSLSGTGSVSITSSEWTRVLSPNITPNDFARLRITCAAGAVVRVVAPQNELGAICTPYIETDGSTESRTAGRVYDDANQIEIGSSQFAVAVRWNPGIANTAFSTGTAVLFEKVVDANNLVRGLYDFANARYELQRLEAGVGSSHTKAHTFTAQSSQTVIFQGTPTGLTISVGGNFDTETANTATPDVSSADLDYGSSAGSSSFLDGNARFISTFTGELTNSDAARIAAMPSPPTWAQLVGALPSLAGVDTLWPGVDATFFKAA